VGSYAKKRTFFVYQIILLLFTMFLCLYAADFSTLSSVKLVLLGCTLLIAVSGLLYGSLASLAISLIVLFLFGTILIWQVYISSTNTMQLWEIVLWMIVFPAAAVVTGAFQKWIASILAENKEMKEKFSSLVTIDEITKFDNQNRFLFHMEEEFKRTQRTHSPFSLLLIKIKYFERFEQLYGDKEKNHLLRSLSTLLWNNLRITDRKFRIADDTFAVILTNTEDENTGDVVRKIESLLKHHQLANKKRDITVTLAFGVSHYQEELLDFTEMIQHAQHDLEQYVQ
jgi:diguanylate cyclase (GGDEF)-like protein